MANNKLKKRLQTIAKQEINSIEKQVANEVLTHNFDCKTFFKDLCRFGCTTSMIGSLVYYYDTHSFYDRHYEEIEELRREYEDSVGSIRQS